MKGAQAAYQQVIIQILLRYGGGGVLQKILVKAAAEVNKFLNLFFKSCIIASCSQPETQWLC